MTAKRFLRETFYAFVSQVPPERQRQCVSLPSREQLKDLTAEQRRTTLAATIVMAHGKLYGQWVDEVRLQRALDALLDPTTGDS